MAEPFRMNTLNMDVSFLKKPDGNVMTTLAGTWNMTEGSNMDIMDGSLMTRTKEGVRKVMTRRNGMRKEVMVEDGAEALSSSSLPSSSSLSSASTDRDSLLASSHRTNGKGTKGGRNEGRAERNYEDKNRKRKIEKKETGRKKTLEEMKDEETCGGPKGVVEHVLEDLSTSALGGTIMDWANRVDMIRRKLGNPLGRFNDELILCSSMIKEGTMELLIRFYESQRENARLEEVIRSKKETEWKEMERKEMERKEMEKKELERKETERKEMERKVTERKEMERKETERKETERKEMERKEMERKEVERKELERKETERKETERKVMGRKETEMERKEMERKELRKKELERKEMERKETELKETERKEMERKEMERKEMERKELEKKELERKETERKETERKMTERKETERKEMERKETERKETKRKELERKELEKKELERKETERKETERKEIERKETERKETERKETERKEMRRKEKERKEMERKEMERKEMERKEMERKEMERKEFERKESEKMEMEKKETERMETKRKEMERKESQRKESERMEMERKETERKEMGRKEKERKEMERKEMERKEFERKESGKMEMEKKETERMETKRKEMERKESQRKEFERMEMERKEMERKETDRKEEVKDEKMCDGPGDGDATIIMDWANMMYRKRKAMKKETERKETERKESERKDMEEKELERKETERRETERKVDTDMARLKEEIRRLNSSLHLCKGRLLKADAAANLAQSTTMGLLMSEGNDASPPLIREEFPSLPPLSQRINRNSIARSGGDRSSVVQSPPPMVNRGLEGMETSRETYKGGRTQGGVMSGSETEWRLVGGGRRRRDPPSPPPPLPDGGRNPPPSSVLCNADVEAVKGRTEQCSPIRQHPKRRPIRPPLLPAVLITGRAVGFSYAAALRKAREQIDLDTLGIRSTSVRKATNGGLLIEISGEDSRAKAEELATRIRGVLKETATVSCPTKRGELRVVDFDGSVLPDEIARILSSFGGCSSEDVRIGPIRTSGNGLGTVWVQLPIAAATKLADIDRIRLGWTMARVELLKTRPLQCYRCWRHGHTQSTCHSVVDRRNACFNCGQMGHLASACLNRAFCAVCHDAGVEATHRLGGSLCVTQTGKQRSITLSTKGSACSERE